MIKPFLFKRFKVNQSQCAMKIGTDSVLLGAWTSLNKNPNSILDIGSGTGVLALMLAQRSSAIIIDAIEIDADAFEQCVDNFEQSPWRDRLFCYHTSLENFASEIDNRYDLIICNPPFYKYHKTKSLGFEQSIPNSRKIARFQNAMPFEHLLESVAKLLSADGVFSVIIPFDQEEDFKSIASKNKLYPNIILRVKGTPSSEIKRSLIEFSFFNTSICNENHTIRTLIIETTRHKYTEDYIKLTEDFYLKM